MSNFPEGSNLRYEDLNEALVDFIVCRVFAETQSSSGENWLDDLAEHPQRYPQVINRTKRTHEHGVLNSEGFSHSEGLIKSVEGKAAIQDGESYFLVSKDVSQVF